MISVCKCGECRRCKNRVAAARYRRRHPERQLAAMRAWRERNKERVRRYEAEHAQEMKERKERYAQRHPDRIKARSVVSNALRSGRLEKGDCVVATDCDGPIEAHHPGYSRPLDIVWLCRKHHRLAEDKA